MSPDVPSTNIQPPPPLVAARWRRLVRAATTFQAVAAIVAVPIIWWEVEVITIVGPVLALLGIVIAIRGLAWRSRTVLSLGLWNPLVTASFSLAIATFRWPPHEAEWPALCCFTINAALLVLVGVAVRRSLQEIPTVDPKRPYRPAAFRFSLRAMLIMMTLVAVVTALVASVVWRREWPFFFIYTVIVFAISLAVEIAFDCHKLSARPTPPPDDATRSAPSELLP